MQDDPARTEHEEPAALGQVIAGVLFLVVDVVAFFVGEFRLRGILITKSEDAFAFWLFIVFVASFGLYAIRRGYRRMKSGKSKN